MKLDKADIEYIKSTFKEIENKAELLALLNFCKKKMYGEESHIISIKQLNYHLVPSYNNERYKAFKIKKKSGGDRLIYAPNNGLKVIQTCLNLIFQIVYQPATKNVTGFVPGYSIVDNAKIHVNKNYVFNVDLKDFFNSIDQARIWGRLKAKPFEFSKEKNKLEIANIIASFVCHPIEVERYINGKWEKRINNVLPQGAPTSPVFSNIICERLDFYLNGLAKRFQLKYTRYVDDMTFSSDHNVYQENSDFRKELERIVTQQGFYFNKDKTRLQKRSYRQEVTGVVVNEKINTNKHFVKRLKKWIYLWDNYGKERATEIFEDEYKSSKINFNGIVPSLQDVIKGQLSYLHMLKGGQDSLYITLKNKYERLVGITQSHNKNKTRKTIKLPILHSPIEVVNILKNFSINNTALKYATHVWDGGKDHEVFSNHDDFIEKAREQYTKFSYELKKLNHRLQAKIYTFLFEDNYDDNGWSIYNIKFGWNSPELKLYLDRNSNNKPESFILPPKAQKIINIFGSNITINKFKNVIDVFKNTIEIRDDNDLLEKMLIVLYKDYLKGFKIKESKNIASKNFYVDVDYLYKSLKLIFESIQKRPQHQDIGFVGYDSSDYFCFEIIHFDSNSKGKSINDENFKLLKGDFETIKKNLTNLCDWSIESTFLEGCYRLNFLVSDSSMPFSEQVENTEGFKHIFKFYK